MQLKLPEEPFMGLVLTPDGQIKAEDPVNGSDYELAQLKIIVGGYIEIVPLHGLWLEGLGSNLIMILNEEGKLMKLDFNPIATYLWEKVAPGDYIVGAVLITTGERVK